MGRSQHSVFALAFMTQILGGPPLRYDCLEQGTAGNPRCLPGSVQYQELSNTIVVSGPVACTLTALDGLVPAARLELVDPGARVWLLGSNLVLQQGATLELHGAASGGDVDELRLRSDNVPGADAFVYLRADWGTIDMADTRLTSWAEATGGPDMDPSTGRAYVHVRSSLDTDGLTARVSRMDIRRSDIGYLGYDGNESYGLAWKVNGIEADIFDKVDVLGEVTDSRIHHNFFGVYTFGASRMVFARNEIHHNVQYGLDPHDDSDNLVIEKNEVHGNGLHGIICSKRCDHLAIRGNNVHDNAGHGIMLHLETNDSVVEDNASFANGGDGIAVVASHRNRILRNNLRGNTGGGIRLSAGSAENLIEGNEIAENATAGIHFYRGSDATVLEAGDGRPKRNLLQKNHLRANRQVAINLKEADFNTFAENHFEANAAGLVLSEATGNVLRANRAEAPVLRLAVQPTTLAGANLILENEERFEVQFDTASTVDVLVRSTEGRVSAVEPPVPATVTPQGTSLRLARSVQANAFGVAARGLFVSMTAGSLQVLPTEWSDDPAGARSWQVRAMGGRPPAHYRIAGLLPGATYRVKEDHRVIAHLQADAAGAIAFDAATAGALYSVKLRP